MTCATMRILVIWLALASNAVFAGGVPEALFAEAQRLEERREWKAAITAYRQVVTHEAESRELAARALLRIGACLQSMGRLEEADQAYIQLLWMYPEPREARDEAVAKLGRWWRNRIDQDLELEVLMRSPSPLHVFEGQDIEEAMAWFRSTFGLNVVVDPEALEYSPDGEPNRPLLEVPAGTVEAALTTCLDAYGMVWVPTEGCLAVRVKTCGGYRPQLPERSRETPEWEADDPPWKAERRLVVNRLRARVMMENFENATLQELVDCIAAKTAERIVFDDAVEKSLRTTPRWKIQFKEPVSADLLVLPVLKSAGDWYVDSGVIHITTRKKAEEYRRAHER